MSLVWPGCLVSTGMMDSFQVCRIRVQSLCVTLNEYHLVGSTPSKRPRDSKRSLIILFGVKRLLVPLWRDVDMAGWRERGSGGPEHLLGLGCLSRSLERKGVIHNLLEMRLIPCASSYLIRCLFSYYLISNPSQMNIRHGKIPLVCSSWDETLFGKVFGPLKIWVVASKFCSNGLSW